MIDKNPLDTSEAYKDGYNQALIGDPPLWASTFTGSDYHRFINGYNHGSGDRRDAYLKYCKTGDADQLSIDLETIPPLWMRQPY